LVEAQLIGDGLPIVDPMRLALPPIPDAERTPLVETLLDLVRQLLDRVHQLEETNQLLRDEIALFKGQKPRPQLQPSILPLPAPPNDAPTGKPPRRRGKPSGPRNVELAIDREVPLHPATLPEGAVFQGFEP
jgi:hypothetical protein